nr:iron ABC transporter permease [Alkalibaculum bacchi]
MAILGLCLVSLIFISFLIGRYQFTLKTLLDIFVSCFIEIEKYWEKTLEVVILQVRFPRIILAVLVGGALSISGASYQTLFKNPMVSPDILGVSAGAGFGAALAMINEANWIEIQLSAFVFGLLAVSIAYIISRVFGGQSITVLVLAGVVTSSFFQALLSIVKTLADTDNELPSITFWLMGSLSRATNRDIFIMLPALCISLFLLYFFRHQINALSAGEDVVQTMGVNVPMVKIVVVISSTLMTVVSVGICGIIGWIGMVIPHLARMIVGADYSKMASVSFLIGGIFLLLVDNVIRGVEGVELPLGVLTALVGTPAFVALLSRARQGWN